MLFNNNDNLISLLENYLNANNIIHQYEDLEKELNDFGDDDIFENNIKCNNGVPGYEKYTDGYVSIKKSVRLGEVIKKHSYLDEWARALKLKLRLIDKTILDSYGILFGINDDHLLPSEILYNEQKVKDALNDLKKYKNILDIYKKK